MVVVFYLALLHIFLNCFLIVAVPPVIEGSNNLIPTSVGVPTNQTITLHCVIEEGNPFPRIRWWNGKESLRERYFNPSLEVKI